MNFRTTEASAALLRRVPLFSGLQEDALQAIAAAAHVRTIEQGEAFFREGDSSTAFYVVQSGTVKMTQGTPEGHQVVLRTVGIGDAFGGVAIYGGNTYPVTAEAMTACSAFEWRGTVMAALLERYPALALNTVRFIAARLHELQVQYRQLATEKVERRIARALVRLMLKSGQRVEKGVLIDLPLSREDVAQMTGTTLYTVSRTVSRWEGEGLLEAGRQRVVVLKPDALIAAAD